MDHNEYESEPSTDFLTNVIAGGMAGVLEFGLMYPLDSVRTRMQSLSPEAEGSSIYKTFTKMIKTEGLFRPVRGISIVIASSIPAHGLYYGFYEMSKEFFSSFSTRNNVNYVVSAVIATTLHDVVVNPVNVIKQRLQMYNSPHKTVFECTKAIYQNEGLVAFYRSYTTQLLMNIPFQAIHFLTYEFVQNTLNPERKYNATVHILAGGAAGGAAAAITTPLDVVQTLLNTQEKEFTHNINEAVKRIHSAAGYKGFFKGINARVLYTMPGTAICWFSYEFFKFHISGLDKDEYKSSVSGKHLLKSEPVSNDSGE